MNASASAKPCYTGEMESSRDVTDRVPFVTDPTPLYAVPRLAAAIGLGPDDLLIKRDDLIAFGAGGNKVRKIQYSSAEAVNSGATTLLTTGAPQSNHARITAAAGARLGLDVVLVLEGDPPAVRRGNLLLEGLLGARIFWSPADIIDRRADEIAAELTDGGAKVHRIPFGGTSPHAALGYADAAREILQQAPEFDHFTVAVGSGGTMAGLVSVLGPDRVLGVDCGAVPDARATVTALVADIPGSVGLGDRELRLDTTQVGAGYAHLTPPARQAMSLMAGTEGIFVDPVYTSRALAGLIAAAERGEIRPGQRTIFLHTGGFPGLFGHPDLT
jgi:D-cysteine desulfhydrase